MMLRVALVGLVAALGVTVPSQTRCRLWFESAQNWGSSVLASWDNWKPRDSGRLHGPLNAGGATECPECKLARARLAANERKLKTPTDSGTQSKATQPAAADVRPESPVVSVSIRETDQQHAVSFEPIAVDVNDDAGIAFELNRMSEGLCTAPIVTPAPALAPSFPAQPIAATTHGEAALVVADPIAAGKPAVEPSMTTESCGLAENARTAAEPAEPGQWWLSVVDGTTQEDCLCGESLEAAAPLEVKLDPPTVPDAIATPAAVAATSALAPEFDLDEEFDFEIAKNCAAAAAIQTVSRLPELPGDVFAPARAPVRLESPVAAPATEPVAVLAKLPDDVFGWQEVKNVRLEPPVRTSSAPRSTAGGSSTAPRLGQAVELTRAALYAWMNVLAGPAVVDVSSR